MKICNYLMCTCLVLSACAADTESTTDDWQAGSETLVEAMSGEVNLRYVLDGSLIEQDDMKKQAPKSLIFVYDDRTEREGVVRVFSRKDDAIAYRQAWQPSAPDSKRSSDFALEAGAEFTSTSSNSLIASAPGHVSLYLHANRQGDEWTFYPEDGSVLDFTCAWRVFWVCQSINDRVSSIDNRSRHWAHIYEHTYLSGNQYWVAPNTIVNQVDFNDTASSMDFDYE